MENVLLTEEELKIKDLSIYLKSRDVYYKNEKINLTKKEYNLLEYMALNLNRVLSREKLLKCVWGYEYIGDTHIVDVHIRHIRKKIDDKFGIHLISTVRGIGYVIKN